jgi:hypothetical protein
VRGAWGRGVTLFELLITFSIFTLVLSLTLFFYGQSIKATRRHDQGSEVYRRANDLFSKVERFLHGGILMLVTDHNLMLSPFPQENAIMANRLCNWSQQAQTLSISPEGLFLRQGDERREFFRMQSWEGLSFVPQPFSEQEANRRFDYVTLLYTGVPPSVTRQGRTYQFKRQVLLERY